MLKLALTLFLAAASAFAQYKLEPAGAPPSELAPAIAAELQKTGHKVIGPDGKPFCELWFGAKEPPAKKTAESNVSWTTVPAGALLGAIRFPAEGADRRGQVIQPGVYTMRFGLFPINGDHLGVAPTRDFLVLSPASIDKDAAPVSEFDPLMNMSRKVSGTPHPAVLNMWKVDSGFTPGLTQLGETDWVLQTKIGETGIAVIVVGKAEG